MMDTLLVAAGETAFSPTPFTITLGVLGAVLSIPCWALFLRGVATIVRTIRLGQPESGRFNNYRQRFATMLTEVFGHTRMNKWTAVGWAHWLVMVGFLLGSIVWFEAYIQTFNPAGGWPLIGSTGVYHFLDELLGLGTVIGISWLIYLRQAGSPAVKGRISRFYGSNAKAAYFVEAIVLLEGLGMVFVKAGKIATFGGGHLATDFVTMHLAMLLPASAAMVSVFALVKLLTGMLWLAVVGLNLTWGVAWHRFVAFFSIFFKRSGTSKPSHGALKPLLVNDKPLDIENVDPEEDLLGAGKLTDFTWKGLLDFTACTDCGRCQSQCPAWNTEKPLSPKQLITTLRTHTYASAPSLLAGAATREADLSTPADHGDVIGFGPDGTPRAGLALIAQDRDTALAAGADPAAVTGVIDPDVLWSCTNCGACVEQCPVDIEHIDYIADMRRHQVLVESEFPTELAGLFKNLENKGNPWGQNASVRRTWITELERDGVTVPIWGEDIEDFSDTEFLFWVGCAGAIDDNAKKTTKAVAELLYTAGVKYAVLADGEGCTGDPARRAGNEFLFQMLAEQTVGTLNEVFAGVDPSQRTIVVTCPHCFNTLANEYPELGGKYRVLHHTQLLNRLVREGRLTPVASATTQGKQITYHDPCFLGRHNRVFDAPRELLESTGVTLQEMPRAKERSFCCGAGGARMFMEEKLGSRINLNRTDEALELAPKEIATGCPFCTTMLSDGVTNRADSNPAAADVTVRDVSRMLRDSVAVDGQLPAPREPAFLDTPKRGYVEPVPAEDAAATDADLTPTEYATPGLFSGAGTVLGLGGAAPAIAALVTAQSPTTSPDAADSAAHELSEEDDMVDRAEMQAIAEETKSAAAAARTAAEAAAAAAQAAAEAAKAATAAITELLRAQTSGMVAAAPAAAAAAPEAAPEAAPAAPAAPAAGAPATSSSAAKPATGRPKNIREAARLAREQAAGGGAPVAAAAVGGAAAAAATSAAAPAAAPAPSSGGAPTPHGLTLGGGYTAPAAGEGTPIAAATAPAATAAPAADPAPAAPAPAPTPSSGGAPTPHGLGLGGGYSAPAADEAAPAAAAPTEAAPTAEPAPAAAAPAPAAAPTSGGAPLADGSMSLKPSS